MLLKSLCVILVMSTGFLSVNSQASFGTLGSGLLQPTNQQPGGLVYPNPDGSGPQADSLAAAIYGVAVPPSFAQFSSSDIFFGGQGGPFFGGELQAQPSDLLIGTGLHLNVKGSQVGEGLTSFSTFISDFSPFGGIKPQNANSDLNTAPSSSAGIDPIAARFGVVIPNNDNLGSIFHPSLSGAQETSIGATSTSTSTSTGTGSPGNDFVSPIETSLRFDIPNQVTLPQATQSAPEGNFAPSSGTGLGRSDGLTVTPPVDFTAPSSTSEHGKPPVEIITTAFKFSDEQISKTEEMQRNFEQASGKFTATIVPADFEPSKSNSLLYLLKRYNANWSTISGTESPTHDNLFSTSSKTKEHPNNRFSQSSQRLKEVSIITKGQAVSKTPSPYTYRGNQRDRQLAQQSKTSTVIVEPPPEQLPTPQALNGIPMMDSILVKPNDRRSATYTFMLAPGYLTPN